MSLVHNIVGGAGGGKPSPTDAVLRVTAPSGSTVTIKKGTGASVTPNFYLDGTETDTYFFYIKAADFGTWTVTGTLSGKTKTLSINVTDNIEYSVTILYAYYLLSAQDNIPLQQPFTAAAVAPSSSTDSIKDTPNVILQADRGYAIKFGTGAKTGVWYTNINLSGYTSVNVEAISGVPTGSGVEAWGRLYVWNGGMPAHFFDSVIGNATITQGGRYAVPISNIGNAAIGIALYKNSSGTSIGELSTGVYKIWLE